MNRVPGYVILECMKGLTVCQNFLGLPLASAAVVRKWLDTVLRLKEDAPIQKSLTGLPPSSFFFVPF